MFIESIFHNMDDLKNLVFYNERKDGNIFDATFDKFLKYMSSDSTILAVQFFQGTMFEGRIYWFS